MSVSRNPDAKRTGGLILPLTLIWLALVQPDSARAQAAGDQWLARPVDDQTFQTYLEFFAYDKHLAFETRVIDVEELEGVRKEHLSFQSTRGARVFANFYRPVASTSRQGPAVILLHGGGPGGKDNPGIKQLAPLLTRGGFNVLAIDMQYFGERSTDLLTTFTDPEKHERLYNQPPAYLAWVTQTVKDVSRSFDLLVEQRDADSKRIAVIGISRGAIVGTIAGGADRRLAAVGLLYGGHFDALERGHLPAACPANYIGRISPRPLLMINGTRDTDMIKDTSVEPLQRLAGQPRLILWAETGHQLPTEGHRSSMLRWLQESLK